ncbi:MULTISPECIES: DEAD/DEAH box helicase [Dyadobacter]|uniref:DEAD/DEAH box helicase n=1 Tax=Dyadobacter chenhuakuii TaxID=2909339 RepID=A0A9X1TT72_9BACT|nr:MULTISPECIES: DEAD/DEAH box helicase [Dyadobacter]MCE7072046.1 DEAD/DEAH box helicase [Dyadobacter sp. CY327]MCF2494975.1 DEAD/DEAH box helicase [Dyadobacter chenhuakuii]MCF2498053.1 DEAD/DEAH box helicase [Dyadobacter chenhuakuii]MCF2518946.1 DEAD/DEAH box helicase [Dyadobacter sp. CY351]USJ31710.1 DEAD/DEAH box helicase [Dyadobacter chenhuakuii]
MTFEELNLTKPLLQALADLNYETPTTIQHKVFSVMMSGKDVCGIAQTGTGKTFAYLLPTLRQIEFSKDRLPQLLILVPTRELVVQVVEEVKKLSAYLTLQVVGAYGGGNIKVQMAELKNGADVVVATPGRLFDLALNGSLKTKAIKKLVIDEVDEMLNLGFRTQLKNILDLLPQKRQNLLFSATLTPEVEALMQTYFNNPVRIEAAPVGTPLENIEQKAYYVPNFYTKVNLLDLLLEENPDMTKVLVFVATKKLADQLFGQLEMGYLNKIGVIHSNKEQNHRFNTVKQFHEGNYRVLIATDIIARGLDVAEVSHVFNFDIPEIPENYIHRIGRTGRADKKGVAISFITEGEKERQEQIEELMNYQIPIADLPENLKISEILTPDEEPQIYMKSIDVKLPKREAGGGAFHEKIDKNKKVNVRRNHAQEKMQKYGRPIKRSGKK